MSGLYEQLVTVELQRLLHALDPGRVATAAPDGADTHVAVAEHVRRVIERALRAVPEAERPRRQAEPGNALLGCLGAADYVSHERSRPIATTWRLRKSMPGDFFPGSEGRGWLNPDGKSIESDVARHDVTWSERPVPVRERE